MQVCRSSLCQSKEALDGVVIAACLVSLAVYNFCLLLRFQHIIHQSVIRFVSNDDVQNNYYALKLKKGLLVFYSKSETVKDTLFQTQQALRTVWTFLLGVGFIE